MILKLDASSPKDPIGFAGGDVNLYSYVWNSPYNFIDPFGFQGWGENLADWLDSKIEKAQLGAQGDASNWVWNAAVNTLADFARIGSDTFRLGSGIGCALFNDQASASDKAWAVASDVFRGASIAGAGFAARALAKGIGKAASRASRGASKASVRPLPQFTKSTIDDAVNYAMRAKQNHIFGKVEHNLEPLVNQLGGRENTFRAVLNAANNKLPSRGVFENIPVDVKGYTVYIRGRVHDGIPKLGTMFIP